MSESIKSIIGELDEITIEVKLLFGNLSAEQLNWKPSKEKWSIAQCLDHLIVSNSTYYTPLKAVISKAHKSTFYQSIKFISRFFGDYLIRETGKVVSKPMKSPSTFTPSQSEIAITIVADFEKHQKELSSLILQLEGTDLENTIICSPALSIITYNLKDLLSILPGHEQRHLMQAKNVANHSEFLR